MKKLLNELLSKWSCNHDWQELHENNIYEDDKAKDPVTDNGVKKSAVGLLKVEKDANGKLTLKEQVSITESMYGELYLIYRNGNFYNKTTLTDIRKRIKNV